MASGGDYGERQALESQQQAAPMAAASPAPPQGGAAGQQSQRRRAAEPPLPDVFGPSQRPGEPQTTGSPIGPGRGPSRAAEAFEDPDALVRALYQQFPHDDLRELIERRQQR